MTWLPLIWRIRTIYEYAVVIVLRAQGKRPHYSDYDWWFRVRYMLPYVRMWFKMENVSRP